jgi:hypothetical protein
MILPSAVLCCIAQGQVAAFFVNFSGLGAKGLTR